MTRNLAQPILVDEMQPFFQACAEKRFILLRCKTCGRRAWPYAGCREHDNEPFLANLEWAPASGRGKVFSFTIPLVPFYAAFPPPYVYAIVELDEGPLMPTNIVNCPPGAVQVGMSVKATFEPGPHGLVIPRFEPI